MASAIAMIMGFVPARRRRGVVLAARGLFYRGSTAGAKGLRPMTR